MTRPPSSWTHADVLAAVANHAAETDGLDFKRELYGTDTKELAADVSSMGNEEGGGVIVLGVEEDGDGRAAVPVGVLTSDDETLRMTSAAANLIEPPPDWNVVRLDAAGQPSFYVLDIRPIRDGLHAVKLGGGGYRFFRRDGPGKRPMTLAEVTERLRGDKSVLERVAEIRDRSWKSIPSPDPDGGWLTLTTVPRSRGRWTIDRPGLARLEDQWREAGQPTWSHDLHTHLAPLPVGQGRVVLRDGGDGTSLNFELLDDGSSVLSSSLRFFRGDIIHIGASLLVRRVFYLVGLALQHVAGAGTGGRLEMSLRYSPPPGGFLITGDHHGQQHKWREGEESEDVAAGVNASDVPLLITRELLTGVFHAYGLPEVGYITAEGRLSRRHWHPHGGNDWPTEVWAARV